MDPSQAARTSLLPALERIARYHGQSGNEALGFMDTSDELYLTWRSAMSGRARFQALPADQLAAVNEMDALYERIVTKYHKLPPLPKFLATEGGRELTKRAAELLAMLRASV
ncbi:MAG: hypothetical protein J0L81_16800 [Caulobacterales bacterium]|nr:hypothetical protein [Caulobacterales bacterium]